MEHRDNWKRDKMLLLTTFWFVCVVYIADKEEGDHLATSKSGQTAASTATGVGGGSGGGKPQREQRNRGRKSGKETAGSNAHNNNHHHNNSSASTSESPNLATMVNGDGQ